MDRHRISCLPDPRVLSRRSSLPHRRQALLATSDVQHADHRSCAVHPAPAVLSESSAPALERQLTAALLGMQLQPPPSISCVRNTDVADSQRERLAAGSATLRALHEDHYLRSRATTLSTSTTTAA